MNIYFMIAHYVFFIMLGFAIIYLTKFLILLVAEPEEKLLYAIRRHDIKSIKLLIKNGVDINYKKNLRRKFSTLATTYPLFYAIEENNADIVKLLLNAGANTNITKVSDAYECMNFNSITPLDLAFLKNNKEIIELLKHSQTSLDPLLFIKKAIRNHDDQTIKTIINRWNNINLDRIIGRFTVLMEAAYQGNKEITKLLINAGANPLIKNKNSLTAYDLAIKYGHQEVAQLIREKVKN